MKSLLRFSLLTLLAFAAIPSFHGFAQAPERFNYQGVARDAAGTPLTNTTIGLRLRLRSGSPTGTVVYQETHSAVTNGLGLFTVQVGGGTGGSGFTAIDWGTNSHYIQVEMDANGGTAYQDMGTAQLLSVPYALYAKSSETAGPTGPTGPQGIAGQTGAQGATGLTGAAGPQGIPGSAGAIGPTGPQGIPGQDGAGVVIVGSVANAAALPPSYSGSIGDMFIAQNTGNGHVWDGTQWNNVGQIQGPAGPQGVAGQTGAQGATGPTGPTGLTGATGPAGANGAANAWGLSGNAATSSTNFIGTTDAQPLRISTDGQQRMTIGATGNISIGNPVTNFPLHITHNGNILSGLDIDYTYTGNASPAKGLKVRASTTGTGNLDAAYIQAANSGSANTTAAIYGFNTAVSPENVGVRALANGNAPTVNLNIGGSFRGQNAPTNYGVFASASGGTTNWAGYFGNFTAGDGKVYIKDTLAIGTTVPTARLHLAGNIRIVDGTQGNGKVLTSNAVGLASWQTLPASGSTLDAAYDFGGAGAGRTITADAGALRIQGTDGLLVSGTHGSGAAIEINGAGTRMFFNPRKGAFRAGRVDGLNATAWDDANLGNFSIALGSNVEASGDYSIALGFGSIATGYNSFSVGGQATESEAMALGAYSSAIGIESTALGYASSASGSRSVGIGPASAATGDYSVALGYTTRADGAYSSALGIETTARSYGEMALGYFNAIYTPSSTTAPVATDKLLVVGNGTASQGSDAFTILKNGEVKVGNKGTFHTNVQEGQLTAGTLAVGAGNKKSVTLTFPNAFTTAANVRVLVTPVNEGTNNDVFILSVRSVTATNCVVEIYRADVAANTGWGQNLRVNWMAWE
jgi:hypothetical protein